MGRPNFKLISDSEEDDRNSQSSDNCTETTFNQTLQKKFVEIRKRKRQQAAHISDEGSAEEEVREDSGRSSEEESESEGEQTTKRFVIKTRKQPKRKTKEESEEVHTEEEKPKKKAKKQMKKEAKKEEKTETKKAKIEWKQQKCTLSAFWRMVNGHKDRITEMGRPVAVGFEAVELVSKPVVEIKADVELEDDEEFL